MTHRVHAVGEYMHKRIVLGCRSIRWNFKSSGLLPGAAGLQGCLFWLHG